MKLLPKARYRAHCKKHEIEGVKIYEIGSSAVWYRLASDCFEVYNKIGGRLACMYAAKYFQWARKKARRLNQDFALGNWVNLLIAKE